MTVSSRELNDSPHLYPVLSDVGLPSDAGQTAMAGLLPMMITAGFG
jgi:hypothetical protein